MKEGEMLQTSEVKPLPAASADQRKVVHDLRNLFAIISAGKSLLERNPAPARRREVLDAIEEATRQGARLTTALLANCTEQSEPIIVDISERLVKLAPMVRVLTNAHVDLAQAAGLPALVRMVPEDFDAVVLEIVSNAVAAGASAVAIRAHVCGDRVWMLVSDNGCGMSPATLARARRGTDLGLAHGTGLSRIRHFMDRSGGHLRIRSRPGGGSHIGLIFPFLPKAVFAVDRPDWISAIPLHTGADRPAGPYSVAA
jgi:signal transduction histidine kinase